MKKDKIIEYTGTPLKIIQEKPEMVVEWPRSLKHFHTYGKLTKFFRELKNGRLFATYCSNQDCEEKRLWLPPRADCPDCNQPTSWIEAPNPVIGKIYTFTKVEYPGEGIELEYPYFQIDIDLGLQFATIFKSYLLYGEPYIGMKVTAGFRTDNPTNTILDIFWVPKK